MILNIQVYNLWCRRYRRTYPSTLYVTIQGIPTTVPQEPPAMRSLFPLQEEKGSITFEEMLQLQVAKKRYCETMCVDYILSLAV